MSFKTSTADVQQQLFMEKIKPDESRHQKILQDYTFVQTHVGEHNPEVVASLTSLFTAYNECFNQAKEYAGSSNEDLMFLRTLACSLADVVSNAVLTGKIFALRHISNPEDGIQTMMEILSVLKR